jgi:hypothetical protein
MGGWTRAAPNLYPHQRSWDTGFVAIGLAHLDSGREAQELLVFSSTSGRPARRRISFSTPGRRPKATFEVRSTGSAPASYPTRGRTPAPSASPRPCHRGAQGLVDRRGAGGKTALGLLREIYPEPLRWHRYLATARDPEGSGLVTIYHPWESGTDNSPRWDAPLRAVEVGEMPP